MEDEEVFELANRMSDEDIKKLIECLSVSRQRAVLGAFDLLTMRGIGPRIGLTYPSIKAMRGARLGDPYGFPDPRKLPPSYGVTDGGIIFLGKEINTWAYQSGRKIYT